MKNFSNHPEVQKYIKELISSVHKDTVFPEWVNQDVFYESLTKIAERSLWKYLVKFNNDTEYSQSERLGYFQESLGVNFLIPLVLGGKGNEKVLIENACKRVLPVPEEILFPIFLENRKASPIEKSKYFVTVIYLDNDYEMLVYPVEDSRVEIHIRQGSNKANYLFSTEKIKPSRGDFSVNAPENIRDNPVKWWFYTIIRKKFYWSHKEDEIAPIITNQRMIDIITYAITGFLNYPKISCAERKNLEFLQSHPKLFEDSLESEVLKYTETN